MSSVKRLRLDQRYCPHCSQTVSYKTYRAHKRLYYDENAGVWLSNPSLLHEPPPDVNDEDSLSPVASRSGSPTLVPPEEIDVCESPPASDPGYSATSSSEGK